jgi:hypothetical protein
MMTTAQPTQASTKVTKDGATESSLGKTSLSIKDTGRMENKKVKAYLHIPTETTIRENGWMEYLMVGVNCFRLQSITRKHKKLLVL